MFKLRQRQTLSQNFFYSPHLVKRLLRKSSIGSNDTVLEIGPGKGIITQELLNTSRHVLAIEVDKKLVSYLRKRFKSSSFLTLFNLDFLEFPLPSSSYKVFSNLPFAIEGRVIRKLLDTNNSPREVCIVVRKKVAKRWAGVEREGEFSLLHKPWFEMNIVHFFRRSDFKPKPRVSSVLLRIVEREKPLIREEEAKKYKQFIQAGFRGGRKIDQNLSPLFAEWQLRKLANKLNFSISSKPSDLTFEKWLNLFCEYEKLGKNIFKRSGSIPNLKL